MITVLGSPRRCCDGITRRETLKAGALSSLGISLPSVMAAETARGASAKPGKAKNVIVLYLLGGAPTQDMWDLKPEAPSEVRGEFKPIATAAPDVRISEHLPRSARWMNHCAIVRSVNHKAGCHNTLPSYTGFEQTLDNIVSTKESYPPSMGSVCEYLAPGNGDFPAYVYMPCYLGWGQSIRRPGPYGGFLGKRFDPLFTECAPYVDNPPDKPYHSQPLRGEPRLPDSVLAPEITIDRLRRRRGLVAQFDDQLRQLDASRAGDIYSRQQQRAMSVLTSSRVKAAFDISRENVKLRESYGRTLFGNCALIARKLVQEGVRFVNVTWDCYHERLGLQYECWDTHQRNFPILKDYNLPYFDRTFGALLDDLQAHGLLEETLVVVMSDMGRTPKINGHGGRDHWTHCYSVVFAGAGIKGGSIYGASDSQAAFVREKPASTGDICATIYQCLGIDPGTMVPDVLQRPMPIANGGLPIRDILA